MPVRLSRGCRVTPLVRRLVWVAVILVMAACGGGGDPGPSEPGVVAIASLSLSSSTVALTGVGSETTVSVAPSPANATGAIALRSDNPAVASVTVSGRTATIRAVAGGSTRLVATAGAVEASATIVVTPIARTVLIAPPAGGTSLTVGQTAALISTVTGDPGAATTVSWSSSATSIASISPDGVVSALAPGTVTITATATSNGAATATLQLTIVAAPVVQQVAVTPAQDTLIVGGSRTFVATVTADAALPRTVTWRSSSPAVATIDATGRASAVSIGVTTITAVATADTTKRATAQLTVRALRVTGMAVNAPAELTVGDTARAQPVVTGDPGVNQQVTWASSNAAVATVASGTGLITAVAPGSITITATSVASPAVSASRAVLVRESPGALTWQTTGLGLPAGSPTTQRLRVWSLNQNLAFAVGDSGSLFRLTPTGSTRLGESEIRRVDMTFEGLRPAIGGSSASEIVLAGPGGRLVRWDGAQMQVLSTGGADFTAVAGYGNGSAIAVGSSGRIVRVRNGMATSENSGTAMNLRAVDVRSDNLAVAAGSSGASTSPTVFVNSGGASWSPLPQVRPFGTVGGVAVRAANDIYVALENADVDRFASLYRWNGSAWSRVLPLTPLPTELTRCPNDDLIVGSDGAPWRGVNNTFTRLGVNSWDIHPELNTYSCDVDGTVRVGGAFGFSARMSPGAIQIESFGLPLTSVSVVSPTRAFAAGHYGSLWSFNGTQWSLVGNNILTENESGAVHATATDVWLTRDVSFAVCPQWTLHRLLANGSFETFGSLGVQSGTATGLYTSGSSFAVVASASAASCGGSGPRTSHIVNGARTDVTVPALLPNSARLAVHGIGTSTLFLTEGSGGSGQLRRFVNGAWEAVGARINFEPTSLWVASASLVFAAGSNGGVLSYDGTTVQTLTTGLSALTGVTLVGVWGTSPTDIHVCGANGAAARYDGVRWTLESGPSVSGSTQINACHGAAGIGVQVGTLGTVRRGTGAAGIQR